MIIKNLSGEHVRGGPMGLFYGQSDKSIDDAVQLAIKEARKELPEVLLQWLEIVDLRGGFVAGDDTVYFQVAIRIGYSAKA